MNTKYFFAIVLFGIIVFLFQYCAPMKKFHLPTSHFFVNDKELVPEGIAINRLTGTIYLSSIHKKKIVQVNANGETTDLIREGENGFLWGLGIEISPDGKYLWACTAGVDASAGETYLFQIDLQSKKVIGKYSHDSAKFFNDLEIHENGSIYVTDTDRGAVFRFDPSSKKIEEWIRDEELTYANGITIPPHTSLVIVASGSKGLKKINTTTREISSMSATPDYAVDGLQSANGDLFGAIGWPQDKPETHRVVRYSLDKNYMITGRDTLLLAQPYLDCPTTIAWYQGKLFILGKTNLRAYNNAKYDIETSRSSLGDPLIVILPANR